MGVMVRKILSSGSRSTVGVTHVSVAVSNLTQDAAPFEAEFLVDTGAIDCLAPKDKLIAAGIKPEGKSVYEMADGKSVELEYGFARVSFLDNETVVQIIFGPDDAEPLLGVVALENAGLLVDPVSQGLKRLHAKPLKRLSG